jgi:hypothetical protein
MADGGDEALRRDRDILRREIQDAIAAVRRTARRYRRVSSILVLTTMLTGALATALAGDAYSAGPLAANVAQSTTGKVPAELARGWRNVCGIIALLTLIGTVATGADSVLKIAEHRTKSFACVGALDGLQAALLREGVDRTNLDRTNADLASIRREYAEYFS